MNDLEFAVRQLLMNPGFTAAAVLTLALGIAANKAILTLFEARWNQQPQDRKEIT